MSEIAFSAPQLHLLQMGKELSELYIKANYEDPKKLAEARTVLNSISSPVIGLILGTAIEMEIRDDLKASGCCLECGERKEQSGKCPICSK